MEEIDFSELKLPVGRPEEGSEIERKDLTAYITEQQFIRWWSDYFGFWDQVVRQKAKRHDKLKYVDYMEEFFGEVIDKFQSLSVEQQKSVSGANYPIRKLYELTNLSTPNLFHDQDDNDYFLRVMKTATNND